MSDFQLREPFSGGGGFRSRLSLLGPDQHLRLDPSLLLPHLGWCSFGGGGMPTPVRAAALLEFEEALRPVASRITQMLSANARLDPAQTARGQFLSAGSPLWDKLASALADGLPGVVWQPLTVPGRRNMITGEPATIGTIDPAGGLRYDGVDATVAGTALDSRWLGLSLGIGRRLRFASDLDVSVTLFGDKDALLMGSPQHTVAGGGLSVQGRTSWGADLNIRLGAGRDQTGGPAGFFMLQIGPDIPPAPTGR